MTGKIRTGVAVILTLLFMVGCATDAQSAVPSQDYAPESLTQREDSTVSESGEAGGKEVTEETMEADTESVSEEFDTTIYTIRQSNGGDLYIQQTGLAVEEGGILPSFTCTFQVTGAAGRSELQTITFESYLRSPLAETGEPFEDLNFDGCPDLTFVTYHAHNDNTVTYLWHPDTRRFEEWNDFSGARYGRNPAMKQISEHVHDSAISGMDSVYRFVNPYETQLVWTVDYTYDRYDTDVEDDTRFIIYWYPDGESEVFIDDTFFCADDLSNTNFYWSIAVSEITDMVAVSGGTMYHAYFIYPPASDPEEHIHHYVYLVTDDKHLGAHGETECDKDVADMAVSETNGKYTVTLTYADGSKERIELQAH